MQHRLTCKHCGHKIGARLARSSGNAYGYYYCNGRVSTPTDDPDRCDLPYFRVGDALVWNWLRAQLVDPEKLENGLRERQNQKEAELEPIQAELEATQEQLVNTHSKRDKLLDLYLDGSFDKETLDRRKRRLDETIRDLRSKESRLKGRISDAALNEEAIQSIMDLANLVSQRLGAYDDHFETRRRLVELLDVQAELAIENGEKVVQSTCVLDPDGLSIATGDTSTPSMSAFQVGASD